jgi:hypothetical protein
MLQFNSLNQIIKSNIDIRTPGIFIKMPLIK